MTRIAKAISLLLHPLLMPLYATIVMLYATPLGLFLNNRAILFILVVVFFFTSFTPFLFVLLFYKFGFITSLSITERRERGIPLLFGALMCYVCYVFLSRIVRFAPLFPKMFFLLTIFLLLLMVITKFWKISLHMSAIGGLLAIIIILSYQEWLLLIVIFLTGLLGTSRLWLKAHNSIQIYGGFFWGFLYFSTFLLV